MRAGAIPTGKLATHRGALADSPELFREWIRPEAGAIKALIEI